MLWYIIHFHKLSNLLQKSIAYNSCALAFGRTQSETISNEIKHVKRGCVTTRGMVEGPGKEEWGARGSMKQVTCFSESSQRSWVLWMSHNMAEGESNLLIWKLKVKAIFQS